MKYFFDTEFIEHKGGIDLISIGIIAEDDRTFYAISKDFKPRRADKWVKENVIAKLAPKIPQHWHSPRENQEAQRWMKEKEIKKEIIEFIGDDRDPEFYAYYADYDWVIFARLFGRMIDLPEHFPMWCRDLKQMMWERGLTGQWKNTNVPENENDHHALEDAKWNFELYKKIMSYALPTQD